MLHWTSTQRYLSCLRGLTRDWRLPDCDFHLLGSASALWIFPLSAWRPQSSCLSKHSVQARTLQAFLTPSFQTPTPNQGHIVLILSSQQSSKAARCAHLLCHRETGCLRVPPVLSHTSLAVVRVLSLQNKSLPQASSTTVEESDPLLTPLKILCLVSTFRQHTKLHRIC